jgi:hypothetical protein
MREAPSNQSFVMSWLARQCRPSRTSQSCEPRPELALRVLGLRCRGGELAKAIESLELATHLTARAHGHPFPVFTAEVDRRTAATCVCTAEGLAAVFPRFGYAVALFLARSCLQLVLSLSTKATSNAGSRQHQSAQTKPRGGHQSSGCRSILFALIHGPWALTPWGHTRQSQRCE